MARHEYCRSSQTRECAVQRLGMCQKSGDAAADASAVNGGGGGGGAASAVDGGGGGGGGVVLATCGACRTCTALAASLITGIIVVIVKGRERSLLLLQVLQPLIPLPIRYSNPSTSLSRASIVS
jgi:hypothetical protein